MIDEAMQKYGIDRMDKFYPLSKLHSVLLDLGIINMQRQSFTNSWFKLRIKHQKLILPQKPDLSKYKLTGQQIKKIVEAFVPGGSGYYDYREDLPV